MTNNDDFWDFVAFWEFFNPFEDEEKGPECLLCGKEFGKGDKIEVLSKEEKTFRCPDCDAVLQLDPAIGELEEVEEKVKEVKKEQEETPVPSSTPSEQEIIVPSGHFIPPPKLEFNFRGKIVFYFSLVTLGLKAKKKNDVLREIAHLFTSTGVIKNELEYYQNLLGREELGSTGLGQGVAFPYSFADLTEEGVDIAAGLAIVKDGIDFDTLDGEPARIIWMSAMYQPKDRQPIAYLKFLATLSRLMRNRKAQQVLLAVKSRDEAFEFIKDNLCPKP